MQLGGPIGSVLSSLLHFLPKFVHSLLRKAIRYRFFRTHNLYMQIDSRRQAVQVVLRTTQCFHGIKKIHMSKKETINCSGGVCGV